jgi:quinolinate synthase
MSETGYAIDALRREWGSQLLILGHHYQRASLLKHVDETGDSLELSRKAAGSSAERIVFCGVRFMAESADILTAPGQAVYMPVTSAGCPMSEVADRAAVDRAWLELQA